MSWQKRIDRPGAPAVPIVVKRMNRGAGRIFWVSPRNKALAAATYAGERFTLRELAARVGMSVSGVKDALRSMAAMGIGVLTTARGCRGFTRFRVQQDVVVGNVRSTDDRDDSEKNEPVPVGRTFHLAVKGMPHYGDGNHLTPATS